MLHQNMTEIYELELKAVTSFDVFLCACVCVGMGVFIPSSSFAKQYTSNISFGSLFP